ncbi:MAG: A/G-specific adenine glycosylase [Clostridia bacterium]|nr:A/G-specific adenine glycosylase [Clostridia bacterium]
MTDFARKLICWYAENRRDLPWRHTDDPYRIWVSEIMLQQTRVEAVKPYYERFLSALPDVTALAGADDELLNKLWQGLGYYARVRNMKKAAQICVKDYGGRLPGTYKELLTLPGVGAYTAAAIAAFAYGEAHPAVDGNVKRVVSRYLGDATPVEEPAFDRRARDFLYAQIPPDRAAAFDQALIELGATVCGPDREALCGGCPLVDGCAAFRDGKTTCLPVRKEKKERKTEERTVLCVVFNGKTALCKRPGKGLLSGLWEPPTLEGAKSENEVRAYLTARGVRVQAVTSLPPARHIFTHIVWEMKGYKVEALSAGEFDFYGREEYEKRALPSAFKPFFADLLPKR